MKAWTALLVVLVCLVEACGHCETDDGTHVPISEAIAPGQCEELYGPGYQAWGCFDEPGSICALPPDCYPVDTFDTDVDCEGAILGCCPD